MQSRMASRQPETTYHGGKAWHGPRPAEAVYCRCEDAARLDAATSRNVRTAWIFAPDDPPPVDQQHVTVSYYERRY